VKELADRFTPSDKTNMIEDITMPSNPDMCYASPSFERLSIVSAVPAVATEVLPSSNNTREIGGDPGGMQFSKNVSRR
jgi:hypothetical protein